MASEKQVVPRTIRRSSAGHINVSAIHYSRGNRQRASDKHMWKVRKDVPNLRRATCARAEIQRARTIVHRRVTRERTTVARADSTVGDSYLENSGALFLLLAARFRARTIFAGRKMLTGTVCRWRNRRTITTRVYSRACAQA